jgi:hypothetical protein
VCNKTSAGFHGFKLNEEAPDDYIEYVGVYRVTEAPECQYNDPRERCYLLCRWPGFERELALRGEIHFFKQVFITWDYAYFVDSGDTEPKARLYYFNHVGSGRIVEVDDLVAVRHIFGGVCMDVCEATRMRRLYKERKGHIERRAWGYLRQLARQQQRYMWGRFL